MNLPPKEGRSAPGFDLPGSGGERVALTSLKGRPVVLYFYPKDDTPGCTKEAKDFAQNHGALAKEGATVLGVSPDRIASHNKFIAKLGLPFLLLEDSDHAVADSYGVWVEKSTYGRNYMGIQRSTFLIDRVGVIRRIWPKVRPEGHATEVLTALKELQA